MKNDWINVDKTVFSDLLKKINSLHQISFYSEESSSLREKGLSFYGNLKLVEATEFASHPPLTMRFLVKGGEVFKLDGSKETIYDINKEAEMNITLDNAIDYAKFLMGSIMTEDGSFRIVQSMDEVEYSNDPKDDEIKLLEENVKPAKIKETGNGYEIICSMLYDDCVYKAKLSVTKDGLVDIEEEKLIATEMPTRQIFLK